MNEFKLVFTGTMGAGKTTAINAISEIETVKTDVKNTDQQSTKALTTVGLDYGLLTLENGDRVRLFGTPGQSRFDFMWKIIARDAFGLIILVDNSRPEPLADLDQYLEGFAKELMELPCVIGVGRMEQHATPNLDDYAAKLSERDLVLPVTAVDVRNRDEVIDLVDLLMVQAEVFNLQNS